MIGELPPPGSLPLSTPGASSSSGLTSGWTLAASVGAGALVTIGAGVLGSQLGADSAVQADVAGVAQSGAANVDQPALGPLASARVSLSAPAADRGPGGGEQGSAGSTGEIELVETVILSEESEREPARPVPMLAGKVLDLAARPVADLAITAVDDPESVLGESAASGEFHFPWTRAAGRLVAASEEYATLRAAVVGDLALVAEPVIVVGRAVDLGGRVIDEAGVPLEGVRISLVESDLALHGFPHPLQRTTPVERVAQTTADGSFALDDCVHGSGLDLRVELEGYLPGTLPVPAFSDTDLEIALLREPMQVLHGVVLHRDGLAAGGALVQLGDFKTRSDNQGLFRLEHRRVAPETALRAVAAGYAAGQIPSFGSRLSEPGSPAAVRIVLGGPARSIAGRVTDHRGRPLEGWEAFAVPVDEEPAPDAALLASAQPPAAQACSAADGGFLLTGLEDGDYVVQAINRANLLSLRSAVVRPGDDAPIELAVPERPFRRVGGRVVTREGSPLPDARVTVVLACSSLACEGDYLLGVSARTDGQGTFSLPQVPLAGVDLRIDHAEVSGVVMDLEPVSDWSALQIEVPRDRFVQVLDDAAAGRTVALVDDEGEIIDFFGSRGDRRRRAHVRDGRSSVLQTNENAAELIVFEDEDIVERRPLPAAGPGVSMVHVGAAVGSDDSTASRDPRLP